VFYAMQVQQRGAQERTKEGGTRERGTGRRKSLELLVVRQQEGTDVMERSCAVEGTDVMERSCAGGNGCDGKVLRCGAGNRHRIFPGAASLAAPARRSDHIFAMLP
jgi:hypothetical protein